MLFRVKQAIFCFIMIEKFSKTFSGKGDAVCPTGNENVEQMALPLPNYC
jgi:hypothetical protein